nr:MAG TPA: hypothetical protein [Caudoviricetes sp.]
MNSKMKRTLPTFHYHKVSFLINTYTYKRDGISPVSFYFTLIMKYTPSLNI